MVNIVFTILAFAIFQSVLSNPLPQIPTELNSPLPGLDGLQDAPGLSTVNDLAGGIVKRGLESIPLPGLGMLGGIAGATATNGNTNDLLGGII
ncbi:hypothetical protein GALMADRAFT_136842 [Galerina marginata CBS 339.88]|uniref:Uncharacterized protein n=1 Tax=Galerina marginata (strain CBS 339.88) TaxID=685588 RepID=A0A067TDB9_GALM3|nr:hypothetical protein GALMADRAFT_136842 [Galerina marginata CBS 339.88]